MSAGRPQNTPSFLHSPSLILDRLGVPRPSQEHGSGSMGERNLMGSPRQSLLERAGNVLLYACKARRHLNLRKDENNKYIPWAQESPIH